MRISSTSLTLLALSLSMANGALPLSRQLGHALESIQQQQSNTRSLTFKKSLIRALQAQTDTEQEMDPDLLAAMPCLQALMTITMEDGGDGDGGDVGDGGGDDEDNPLAFLDGLDTDGGEICDRTTGICDFSSGKDEAKIECDETGGKIISNDFLICKEDMDDVDEGAPDMDIIYNNVPICFPQICPDDANMFEMMGMMMEMLAAMFEGFGGDETVTAEPGTEIDLGAMFTKQECASGTKLATSDKKDTETGGGSSAAVRNIIWSFSVAAAVGIGAFLAV